MKIQMLDKLFAKLRYELVPAPRIGEIYMRDVKDQPILISAIENNVDVLVTGDKHFLELDIETLQSRIVSQLCCLYLLGLLLVVS